MGEAPRVSWSDTSSYGVSKQYSAIADLNGDGVADLVLGNFGGYLYAFDGATGQRLWVTRLASLGLVAPAVADLDGDGTPEVVTGSFADTLFCVNGATGELEWSFGTGDIIDGAPTIADVDGDGELEVLCPSWDTKLYCLNADGSQEWTFRATRDVGAFQYSPAVADVNGDGILEVFAPSADRYLYAIRGSDGDTLWMFYTGDYDYSPPTLVDADGDGELEVLLGSGSVLLCLNASDGSEEWRFTAGDSVSATPSAANVDSDPQMEVFFGSWDSTLYCLDGATGEVQWSQKLSSEIRGAGVLVDINGDGHLEYLASVWMSDTVYCFNAQNGSLLWKVGGFSEQSWDVREVFAGDLDGDGCSEVVVYGPESPSSEAKVIVLDDQDDASGCGSLYQGEEEAFPRKALLEVGSGVVRVTLPKEAKVDLSLYDFSGRLSEKLFSGWLSQGTYSFNLNQSMAGARIVVLKVDGTLKSKVLINP